jgi:hypothetical protein
MRAAGTVDYVAKTSATEVLLTAIRACAGRETFHATILAIPSSSAQSATSRRVPVPTSIISSIPVIPENPTHAALMQPAGVEAGRVTAITLDM